MNIAITLLPFNYKADEAYRDKFLIQVIFPIVTYYLLTFTYKSDSVQEVLSGFFTGKLSRETSEV